MKLILLQLLVCIYALSFGQLTGWQEVGKTACGPVLIKLGELPDSTVSGAYELKLSGSPEAGCEVVVRTYFMTISGKKVYHEVTLGHGMQWQGNGKVAADSLIGFMHSEIISAAGCACPKEPANPKPDSIKIKSAPAILSGAADTVKAAVLAQVPNVPATPATAVPSLPDTAAATMPLAAGSVVSPEKPRNGKEPADADSPTSQKQEAVTSTFADSDTPTRKTITADPAVLPDTALADGWNTAGASAGVATDSAVAVLEPEEEIIELDVLSAAELDSIRIYSDPFIQEGLGTIANAFVMIDQNRASRLTVPNAGMELELLEEKQQIFIEKYATLVKTGNYGLRPCSSCSGNPIIHKPDSYPAFVSCEVCKGGGYELTYNGKAKPGTIEHLYFAELLPAPDYRKPTSKRVAENPADFEYGNGIFKTNAETISPSQNPYFFVCFYFKAKGNAPNRMFITEVLDKRKNEAFVGADKESVRRMLELYFPVPVNSPGELYIWEFNTAEDAYDRSIIPLHRAGVVGFEIDVIKYLPDAGTETGQTTVVDRQ